MWQGDAIQNAEQGLVSEKVTSHFGKKAWKREFSGNGKERVFKRHIQGDNGNVQVSEC